MALQVMTQLLMLTQDMAAVSLQSVLQCEGCDCLMQSHSVKMSCPSLHKLLESCIAVHPCVAYNIVCFDCHRLPRTDRKATVVFTQQYLQKVEDVLMKLTSDCHPLHCLHLDCH